MTFTIRVTETLGSDYPWTAEAIDDQGRVLHRIASQASAVHARTLMENWLTYFFVGTPSQTITETTFTV